MLSQRHPFVGCVYSSVWLQLDRSVVQEYSTPGVMVQASAATSFRGQTIVRGKRWRWSRGRGRGALFLGPVLTQQVSGGGRRIGGSPLQSTNGHW